MPTLDLGDELGRTGDGRDVTGVVDDNQLRPRDSRGQRLGRFDGDDQVIRPVHYQRGDVDLGQIRVKLPADR